VSDSSVLAPYEAIALATGALKKCPSSHPGYQRAFDNAAERDAFAAAVDAFTAGDLAARSLADVMARLASVLNAATPACCTCGR
jgi:hypothetical protein